MSELNRRMLNVDNLSTSLNRVVEYAGVLAQRARNDLRVSTKSDGSIITNADSQVELWLVDQLQKIVPGSGFIGEESGYLSKGDEGTWIVDPIDGTLNYSTDSPLWAVSVAFFKDNNIHLSEICLPDLGETYSTIKGKGVKRNGVPLPECHSRPTFNNNNMIACCDRLLKHISREHYPGKLRCTGSVVLDACFLAANRFDGVLLHNTPFYDIAGSLLMLNEVGAKVQSSNPIDFSKVLTEKYVKGVTFYSKPDYPFKIENGIINLE